MIDDIQSIIDITTNVRETIQEYINKMQSGQISKQDYIRLQYLLLYYEGLYHYKYPLCKTTLTDDKVMFISDTHYGNRKLENNILVNIAYNEALRQNIKTVIHAGDLIEACCVDYNKPYEQVLQELKKAISEMPNEITTRLLLGNHDYSAIRTHPKLLPYYFSEKKLDILGMMKVLINWQGIADIYLEHQISQLKEPNSFTQHGVLHLEGHHHNLKFLEEFRILNIPSLSNDFALGGIP